MNQISKIIIGVIVVVVIVGGGYYLWQQNESEEEVFYGILEVIPEGWSEPCIAQYYISDSSMEKSTPIIGEINENDSGLLIKLNGEKTIIKFSKEDCKNESEKEGVKVNSYETLSSIPYHNNFLVDKAGEYTNQKYPCLAGIKQGNRYPTNWNKEFSWEILENNIIALKVRMSGKLYHDKSSQFYELWYDGNSGSFIKEIRSTDEPFCINDENEVVCTSDADCSNLDPDPKWGEKKCWYKCPIGPAAGIPGSSDNPGKCMACPPTM
ncbi:MAG: hypothetical protein HYV34_03445 [Candidatus Kerfeldbacteria bacterium]|nr:hypothetical protein [Candidatus Kerfeldbacteria bacterium]